MGVRIVGRAWNTGVGREGESDGIIFAAKFPGPGATVPAGALAWLAPGTPPHRGGGPPCFATEIDLRPYFGDGDPVEIDPYQGLVRHLRKGYAFPVRPAAA